MAVNNEEKVAKQINKLHAPFVEAVADDGAVIVKILRDKERIGEIVEYFRKEYGALVVGDGVQEGEVVLEVDGEIIEL